MNKQTRSLKKLNMSCKAARGAGNTTPTFKEYPAGSQPSKRTSPWKGAGKQKRGFEE